MALTPAPDWIAAGLRHTVTGFTFRLTGHRPILSARQQLLKRPVLQQLVGVSEQRLDGGIGGSQRECEGDGQSSVPIHHTCLPLLLVIHLAAFRIIDEERAEENQSEVLGCAIKAKLFRTQKLHSVNELLTAHDDPTEREKPVLKSLAKGLGHG
jgi:hypothetical protein